VSFLEVMLNQIFGLVSFALMAAGVWKAFQIANDLAEMKDILRDISRNTRDYSIAPPARSESPVALVQAVNAEASLD
jgi:hypothetical protein